MPNVDERTKQEWRCESRLVRTLHSTSGAAVRQLGRIRQRIFLPNPEAALVEPFGNGLVRVGSQGLFPPSLQTCDASFPCPIYFLAPANRPWVSEDAQEREIEIFCGLQIGRPSKFLQGLWASFSFISTASLLCLCIFGVSKLRRALVVLLYFL